MGRYIVLYHAPGSVVEVVSNLTPEEMKEGMNLWMAWAGRCGDSLVDMGAPLGGGKKLTKLGSTPSD